MYEHSKDRKAKGLYSNICLCLISLMIYKILTWQISLSNAFLKIFYDWTNRQTRPPYPRDALRNLCNFDATCARFSMEVTYLRSLIWRVQDILWIYQEKKKEEEEEEEGEGLVSYCRTKHERKKNQKQFTILLDDWFKTINNMLNKIHRIRNKQHHLIDNWGTMSRATVLIVPSVQRNMCL